MRDLYMALLWDNILRVGLFASPDTVIYIIIYGKERSVLSTLCSAVCAEKPHTPPPQEIHTLVVHASAAAVVVQTVDTVDLVSNAESCASWILLVPLATAATGGGGGGSR